MARHSDARPASHRPSHSSGERSGTCKWGRERVLLYLPPARTDIYRVLASAALRQRMPRPPGTHPGEATGTALSQQQGGSGSAVEAPHGALDTSPPRPELCHAPGIQLHLFCQPPQQRRPIPCHASSREEKPPGIVPSGVDPSHFIPRANPSAVGWPPWAPRAHPRSWGRDGPAGLRQLRSAETPPRQGLQLATASLIRTGLWSNSAVPGAELTPELGFPVRGPLEPEASS